MTYKFSEKVLHDLKEHSFRYDFGFEALLPCGNRLEREQMTVFLDAVQLVYEDELVANLLGDGVQKDERALKFAALEKVGQVLTSARSHAAAQTRPTATHGNSNDGSSI